MFWIWSSFWFINLIQQAMLEKQAQERMQARQKIVTENLHLLPPGSGQKDPNEFFQNYRDKPEADAESDDGCEDEMFDEDDDRGGIFIQYTD